MLFPWDLVASAVVGIVSVIFGCKKAREARTNRRAAETKAAEARINRRAAETMATAIKETDSTDAAAAVKARRKDDPDLGEAIAAIVNRVAANVFDKK